MNVSALTLQNVFQNLESTEDFPIDFDSAWQWAGYSRKDNALRMLKTNFEQDFDYSSTVRESLTTVVTAIQKPEIEYMLTNDCFREFCMMSGTKQGKEVRRYYLNCERALKEQITLSQQPPSNTLILASEERIASVIGLMFDEGFNTFLEERMEITFNGTMVDLDRKIADFGFDSLLHYQISSTSVKGQLMLGAAKDDEDTSDEYLDIRTKTTNEIAKLKAYKLMSVYGETEYELICTISDFVLNTRSVMFKLSQIMKYSDKLKKIWRNDKYQIIELAERLADQKMLERYQLSGNEQTYIVE